MKTNLDALFKTDKSLEKDGIWIKISETIRFRIRRWGGDSAKFKQAMAKYHKPYARRIELDTLSDKEKVSILVKVFCEACLVTWEGVESEGKPLECNFENSVKLFESLTDLFNTLYVEAGKMENFKEEFLAEESVSDLGNS